MSASPPTENDLISRLRFYANADQEALFKNVEAILSTQAAHGMLRSGATVQQVLTVVKAEVDRSIDRALDDVARAVALTGWSAKDVMNWRLVQFMISFVPQKRQQSRIN